MRNFVYVSAVVALAGGFGQSTSAMAQQYIPPLRETTMSSHFNPVFTSGTLEGCEFDFVVAQPRGKEVDLIRGYLLFMKAVEGEPGTAMFLMSGAVGSWPTVGQDDPGFTPPADFGLQNGLQTNFDEALGERKLGDGGDLMVPFRVGPVTRRVLLDALIDRSISAYYARSTGELSTVFNIQLDAPNASESAEAGTVRFRQLRNCLTEISFPLSS